MELLFFYLLLLIKLKRFSGFFTKSNFYVIFDDGVVVFYRRQQKNLTAAKQIRLRRVDVFQRRRTQLYSNKSRGRLPERRTNKLSGMEASLVF